MNELALFAGAGGGILGGKLLGWRTVCAVELDAYARQVLLARQDDGSFPAFPVWDDVRTFDGGPWRGVVDIVTGGFPCQDISAAGRGAGIDGERSGLWREMRRIVGEVGPRYVLVENSPYLVGRGLDTVLGDLAALGYDARWGVLGAADAIWSLGRPCRYHARHRIWICGVASAAGLDSARKDNLPFHADGERCEEQRRAGTDAAEPLAVECRSWWATEPGVGRVADGVAARVDRVRCIGNGQVPAVVRLAWETLRGKAEMLKS